jgi:Lipocalin-like domain
MSAYSGTYRVEGNKLIVSIKNSSIESWNGTDRIPTLEFKGKTVTGTSAPFKSLVFSQDVVAVTTWERVE